MKRMYSLFPLSVSWSVSEIYQEISFQPIASIFIYIQYFANAINKMHVCVCVKSLSHAQLFVTLWSVAHQAPLFMELSILEWIDIPFSRGCSKPRDQTQVSHICHCLSHQGSAIIKITNILNIFTFTFNSSSHCLMNMAMQSLIPN